MRASGRGEKKVLKTVPVRRIALAILLLAVCIASPFAFPLLELDAAWGVLGLLLPTDTEYAAGYTHRRFTKVRAGMTHAEVIALVGEPLFKETDTAGNERCWYSRSPHSTDYRFRMVEFKSDGLVRQVHSEFYFD